MRLAIGLAMVALVTAVVGCGSQSAPTPATKVSPGGAAPAEKLIGRWKGTMQVNETAVRAAVPPEQADAALANLQAMRMQMDFRPDGTLLLAGENHGRPYESQASWELVSQEGQKVTLRSVETKANGAAPQEKTIDLRFEGDDSFTMPLQTEVAELGSFRFTRLR